MLFDTRTGQWQAASERSGVRRALDWMAGPAAAIEPVVQPIVAKAAAKGLASIAIVQENVKAGAASAGIKWGKAQLPAKPDPAPDA